METVFQTTAAAEASRQWWIVDAEGKTLGRLATEVASLLRGKHKPTFAPHNDGGDFVVIINASKVRLSGNKLEKKIYRHHTGYVGGVKEVAAGDLRDRNPEKMLRMAVWGMLPKGPLGRQQLTKLKIYGGSEHPHGSQSPRPYTLQFVN